MAWQALPPLPCRECARNLARGLSASIARGLALLLEAGSSVLGARAREVAFVRAGGQTQTRARRAETTTRLRAGRSDRAIGCVRACPSLAEPSPSTTPDKASDVSNLCSALLTCMPCSIADSARRTGWLSARSSTVFRRPVLVESEQKRIGSVQ